MEESPKQHSSMPCMAEAMSKIKTAASTTQYSGSESSPPRKLSETLSKKYEKMFKKQNHEIVEEITPML